MKTNNSDSQKTTLHPDTSLGHVTLAVADLQRSLAFYENVMGMQRLTVNEGTAHLGTKEKQLLILHEKPGAIQQPGYSTGLYHIAILVPSRPDLAHVIAHLAEVGYPLQGYTDHLVSEAFYLADPDGNGLEIYRDRPRDQWQWANGTIQMDNAPIDFESLFAETPQKPWVGLPDGTRIGHMHLRVGDIDKAVEFYGQIIGFDLVARMTGAAFLSAGGYHHHLGVNVWHSRGASPPPSNAVGLQEFVIQLPSIEEVNRVRDRLQAAQIAYREESQNLLTHDPWSNALRFQLA